jgi:polar amino acid transport system substrate-binding protein
MNGLKQARFVRLVRCMIAVAAVLGCASGVAQTSVRFLTLDDRTMPFGEIRRDAHDRPILVAGIIKDWQDALAGELGRSPVTVLLPRLRQESAVAQKQADLRCFVSPAWLTSEQIGRYDWPAPFLEVEERIIGARNGPGATTFDDLHGRTIGTVLGYSYRSLEPLFANGQVKRDIAPSETTALLKQLAGRTDFLVMRTLDFYFLRKRDVRMERLEITSVVINRYALHCARPKDSPVSLHELIAAQDRLLETGAMKSILAKYR